jgi:hypothetical protein
MVGMQEELEKETYLTLGISLFIFRRVFLTSHTIYDIRPRLYFSSEGKPTAGFYRS